uniref:Proline dehydrogenase n=1 Tax=Callorhinchus milii TaxID=7868 RepID=A0A4W3GM29_CALMI
LSLSSLSLSHSLSLTVSLVHFSLFHCQTHSLTLSHSLTISLSDTLPHSLSLTVSLFHCRTLSHSLSQSHYFTVRHTLSLSLSLSQSHYFTVRHTHSHTLFHSRMRELNIEKDDGIVCFGQLMGMCDHVSVTLGMAGYMVYKSLPYGAVDTVIPYLVRRAQENQAVLQGVRQEQKLLRRELRRRFRLPGARTTPS